MVDAGRVPETLDYYRRVIDFCADWELNTLHFRLADDQGTALRFNSVPDLVVHKNAFAPEQLKDLAGYAQTHGIDLIPELESFGHTGFITRSPAYAHLLDRDAQGSSEFTASFQSARRHCAYSRGYIVSLRNIPFGLSSWRVR